MKIRLLALGLALAATPAFAEDFSYGQPGAAKAATRTVTIEASEIKYNVAQLSFKTGETVRFVLVNKGTQDHALMIGDAAALASHREMMAAMGHHDHMAMAATMAPEHSMHERSSIEAKPGETKDLVWQFTKPGRFVFACTEPGHADLGMTGEITVQ